MEIFNSYVNKKFVRGLENIVVKKNLSIYSHFNLRNVKINFSNEQNSIYIHRELVLDKKILQTNALIALLVQGNVNELLNLKLLRLHQCRSKQGTKIIESIIIFLCSFAVYKHKGKIALKCYLETDFERKQIRN